MFKFMKSPAYWWPVTLRVPAEDDPGQCIAVKFEAQFKRMTSSEMVAHIEKMRANGWPDAEYVRPLIVGFRKLLNVDDTEVPFNADSLSELLDVPGAGTALAKAYGDSNDQAATKN